VADAEEVVREEDESNDTPQLSVTEALALVAQQTGRVVTGRADGDDAAGANASPTPHARQTAAVVHERFNLMRVSRPPSMTMSVARAFAGSCCGPRFRWNVSACFVTATSRTA
jgi:hypothetical protein